MTIDPITIGEEIKRLEAEYDRLDDTGQDTGPITLEIGTLRDQLKSVATESDLWPDDTPFSHAVSAESLATALLSTLRDMRVGLNPQTTASMVLAMANPHLFDAVVVVKGDACRFIGFDTRSRRSPGIPHGADIYLRAIYAPQETLRCAWVPILHEAAQRYADRHAQAIGVQS